MSRSRVPLLSLAAAFVLFVLALIFVLPPTHDLLLSFGLDGSIGENSIRTLQIIGAVGCALLALLILLQKQVRAIIVAVIDAIANMGAVPYFVVLIAVALVLRAAWVIAVPSVPYTDFAVYDGLACNVAQGNEYVDDFSDPATDDYGKLAWRAPGFPYMLAGVYAVTGCDAHIGKVLVLAFSVAVVALSYAVSVQAFGERAGRIAGLIVALYPTLIAYSGILGTELPFTCFLLIGLYGVLRQVKQPRWYWLVMIGLSMGIAALIRPNGLVVLLAVPIYWLIATRNLVKAIVYTAVIGVLALLVILPWSLRNQRVFGTFVFITTNGGNVMWEGTQTTAGGSGVEGGRALCEGLTEPECDSYARGQAIQNILGDPVSYARYSLSKLVRLYAFGYQGIVQSVESTSEGYEMPSIVRTGLIAAAQSYHLLILLLAAIGMVWSLRRGWTAVHTFYLLILLAWSALHFLFHGESRYHVPVLPVIAGYAALTLAWVQRAGTAAKS
ncbi:MAG: glycosyltransferase family 39 protein [Anaerolineae bacterium]